GGEGDNWGPPPPPRGHPPTGTSPLHPYFHTLTLDWRACMVSRRRADLLMARGLLSQPVKARPRVAAETRVVPEPQKKSPTRSPGLEEARTMRSRRARGFWV